MKNALFSLILLLLTLIFVACGNGNISIEGLDTLSWKKDQKGCKSARVKLEASFMTDKSKLKGFSQREIMNILGKPDEIELYKRSQKFFIYYINPGRGCEGSGIKTRPRSLYLKFSALDVSNEIFVKEN